MLFQSERVLLRKMSFDMVDVFHAWRNDDDLMDAASPYIELHALSETQDFLMNEMLSAKDAKNYLIIDKESGSPIGYTSLINIDFKNRNADFMIEIGEKSFWGKGYAAETLNMILNYAFLEMNLHRISLKVFSFNTRAINLYTSAGFKKEGVLREALYRNGQWHDIIQMGMLHAEY